MCFATQLFWFAFHSISNFWGRVGGYIQTDSICHQATPLRCTSLKSRIPRHWRYQKGVSTIIETRGSWLLLQKNPERWWKSLLLWLRRCLKGYVVLKVDFVRFHPLIIVNVGLNRNYSTKKNTSYPCRYKVRWVGVLFLPYNHESGNWPKFERELLVIIGLASPLLLRL